MSFKLFDSLQPLRKSCWNWFQIEWTLQDLLHWTWEPIAGNNSWHLSVQIFPPVLFTWEPFRDNGGCWELRKCWNTLLNFLVFSDSQITTMLIFIHYNRRSADYDGCIGGWGIFASENGETDHGLLLNVKYHATWAIQWSYCRAVSAVRPSCFCFLRRK